MLRGCLVKKDTPAGHQVGYMWAIRPCGCCTLRRVQKVIVAICVALRRQHLEHCVWCWTPQDESLKNWISSSQRNPCDAAQGCGRRVWEVRGSFFTREAEGCSQLLNHSLWRTQNQPFLRRAQEKTLGSEHKLQQVKYPVDVKKQCFTMSALDQGLRRCVEFPSLQILSAWLKKALNSLVLN